MKLGVHAQVVEPNNCVNIIISMAKALILAIDSTSLYIKLFAKVDIEEGYLKSSFHMMLIFY